MDKELLYNVGANIKAIRESQNITVRELGVLCNMDYGNISRIECGKSDCRLLTLKAIADALRVDVKDFL